MSPAGTALITGASAGIGYDLARLCAAQGHDLVLVARRRKALDALKTELEAAHSVTVTAVPLDLSADEAPQQLFDATQSHSLHIDVLVNNAGFGHFGPFASMDPDRAAAMIDLNVKALTRLTHLYLPSMLAKGRGRILNVASTAAFQPGPLMAVYYATKAYVLHFSEALADEVADQGVTVTALCPGPTRSEFQAAAGMEYSGLVKGKLPTAAEVAAYGYAAMLQGKRVAVHGRRNRLLAFFVRLAPRRLVTAIVRRLSESKGGID